MTGNNKKYDFVSSLRKEMSAELNVILESVCEGLGVQYEKDIPESTRMACAKTLGRKEHGIYRGPKESQCGWK